MKIIHEQDMPLLARKDYSIEIEYSGATPSKNELTKQLAAFLKHDESLIVLKHVYTRYGELKADVLASLYRDADSLKKIEIMNKKAKSKDGKEKGKKQKAK